MDAESREILSDIVRTSRTAALGTLRDGAPLVSMVLYATSHDFTSFYFHISRLALHTQALLHDPRAALMIAGTDRDDRDPQTIPRVSLQGTVHEVPATDAGYDRIKSLYLAKNLQSAFNFELGDFGLFHFEADTARYVAGFGRIFDLTAEDFRRTAEG